MTEMTPAEAVFFAALAMPASGRAEYLERVCAGNDDLRQQVERMIAARAEVGDFLERPSTPQAAGMTGTFPPAENEQAPTADFPGKDEHVGAILGGKYKLIEEIGEGGMGSVYMALQSEPVKRAVAVKVIKAGMDSKAVLARFEAERQALAMMDHPNIAKVLDAGTTETGRPYFVMELVKGVPITQFCDERKLTPRQRLELFVPVCQAIQHAHQKGIIHRDIKPTNVLVAMYDDRPVPKVIDFGVAKAAGQMLTDKTLMTGFGAVVGTPEYMSPEQANLNNLDIDTRSDVYSLGVLLYELLTGSTPVDRKSLGKAALLEVLRIVREVEAPRPSAKLSTIDTLPNVAANRGTEPAKLSKLMKGELDWVVLKALEKDRTRRYDTANALSRDIQRYLADELVEARPPSTGYRTKKFVRRHKGQVIAVGLIALTLVAGIVGTTFGLIEAKRQEGLAKDEAIAKGVALEAEKTAKAEAEDNGKLANERLVQVEAQKKRADEEKQIAQAVKAFLQNKLLAQADTWFQVDALLKAGGNSAEAKPNPTVRELLDRAALELAPDKIDANFPKQPLVQAEILRTVGVAYNGIGEPGTAINFSKRAEALHRQHLGHDDPATLESMNILANVYRSAGQWNTALPLLEETFKLKKVRLGPDHLDTLKSMSDLAGIYMIAGQPDKGLPLYEETLNLLRKANLDPDRPEILGIMGSLGLAYLEARQHDKALPLLEETHKLTKAKLGPEHPSTLSTMNNLALGYLKAKQLDKALPLFEEALRLGKPMYGPDHPLTLLGMNNLAICYSELKQLDKSVPLLEEVLPLYEKKLGRTHPDTQKILGNLGKDYKDAGRVVEAIPLLEEVYKSSKKHPALRGISQPLADAYAMAGQHDKAQPLLEEALELTKADLGPDHRDTLGGMANVATGYWKLKQLDKSVPLFEELLPLFEKKLGRDHQDTQRTVANLGVNYKDAGRLKEAIPLLEEAYRASKKFPELRIAGPNLLDAYAKAGQHDKALPLLEEVLELTKAEFGTEHPNTLTSMGKLGLAYLEAGQLDKALPLLEEVLKLTRAKDDLPGTLLRMNNLAQAYLKAKQLDKALPLFEESLELHRAKLGTDHPDTLRSMYNLAQAYLEAKQLDKALPLFEKVLPLLEKKLGRTHRQTQMTVANLGVNYMEVGRVAEALPLLEEALELTKAEHGPNHPSTLNIMVALATGYWNLKQLDKSVPLFEELLPLQEKKLGRDHQDTQTTVANLGVNYKGDGRLKEAIPLLEEAYRASKKFPNVRFAGPNLLDAYAKAGQLAEAAKLIDELLTDARKRSPKDSPEPAGMMAVFGNTLLEMKGYTEAEPLLRECLAIREKKEPNDWRTFNTLSMLGQALLGQGKYAEAEPLLVKGYEGMKAREKDIPPQANTRIPEALDRLIELYTATNKPDEVKKYQELRAKYPKEQAPQARPLVNK